MDLDSVMVELTAVRPADFTVARNAHAAQAREAGKRELGRLFRILPGPRRPAPHLAALPGHPSTSSTREPRQRAEARHRTTRA